MSNETNSEWETEPPSNFLNEHYLYRGIHKDLWKQWSSINSIEPNFYITRHAKNGLSVDWSKYAKPSDTLKQKGNDLTFYGIVQVKVGDLRRSIKRNLFPLELHHDPILKNRAHSLIDGISRCNKARIKMELSEIAEWAPNMKPHL